MVGIIFQNNDIYKSIPEDLFCSHACLKCPVKSCKDVWFSTPPKYTTVRVNLLLTTVDKLAAVVNELLTEESVRRGLIPPLAHRHKVLQDCLVIPPWYTSDAQLFQHEQEVVVDAGCGAAVLRGANVFAPGVMGVLPCIQEGDLVSIYVDSAGCCNRGLNVPFTSPGKVFVGNGVMKMSRKHLFQNDLHPKGVAVEVTQSVGSVASVTIPQHLGLLQNLPSVICGHVLSPQPGDKVIDLCAAPGHKATHLATLMDNKGVLVALDKIAKKVQALQALCQSMHIDCVKAFVFDSTKAVSSTPGTDWCPPFTPDMFDRVLLDAPCSALGQRPQFGNKISAKQISSYPALQRKLFTSAVQLVRPGGFLVYSTCTLNTEENEDIVSWALKKFPELKLLPARPLLGNPGYTKSPLSEAECYMVQRFGPPLGIYPEEDTIGFFIAKFMKETG